MSTPCNGEKKNSPSASQQDGGWAWIVMIASFGCQLLIDGTISGFGVIYLEMQKDEHFIRANYSRTFLALPGSIQPAFYLGMGVFASPFIQRLGFRIMGTIGSGMVGGGLALSSFQSDLYVFNFFYGVMAGTGFGVLMICAIVSVNFYFERLRGIASGVAMSGAGVGCLLVPFLFGRLIDLMGWRHALLVYAAGSFVIGTISALCFKPFLMPATNVIEPLQLTCEGERVNVFSKGSDVMLPPQILVNSDRRQSDEYVTGSPPVEQANVNSKWFESELFFSSAPRLIGPSAIKPIIGNSSMTSEPREDAVNQNHEVPNQNGRRIPGKIVQFIRRLLLRRGSNENPNKAVDAETEGNEFGSTVGSRLWKSTLGVQRLQARPGKGRHGPISSRIKNTASGDIKIDRQDEGKFRCLIALDPFERMDIFLSASLTSLGLKNAAPLPHTGDFITLGGIGSRRSVHPGASGAISLMSSTMSCSGNTDRILSPAGDHTSVDKKVCSCSPMSQRDLNENAACAECSGRRSEQSGYFATSGSTKTSCCAKLVSMFDLKLFTESSFLFQLGIWVANQLAYFIPFVYLVDYSTSKGLNREQAIMLSIILGSLHTFGRIAAGFLDNSGWFDIVFISAFGTLLSALVNLVLPFLSPTFTWYAIYAGACGFACAIPIPSTPLLLVRFLGLDRLTASFSNINLCKSIASIVGPMLAVSIVERTEEPSVYFVVAGVCMLVSAAFHLGLCRFPCSTAPSVTDPNFEEDRRALCCIRPKFLSLES
ncbi:unnamed protein product [Calicophoron daubneyi]|uniref:Monocarboxylate transporter 12 n=1 Tax=Calicophoron daubneyi TaxID=300641 RepID=A0AAV2TPP6_CALDB